MSPWESFCEGYAYSFYKGKSNDIVLNSPGFVLEMGRLLLIFLTVFENIAYIYKAVRHAWNREFANRPDIGNQFDMKMKGSEN